MSQSAPSESPVRRLGHSLGGRRVAVAVMAVVLILAGIAVYARDFSSPFVYLDLTSIRDNLSIRHLFPLSEVLQPPTDRGITVEGRPLVNLSLALNYALSGPNVWSYHVFNVGVHLLAALALFGIVRHTFARLGWADATLLGGLAALLWEVHPLQTECVAYLIQRAESMMGLFYLLSLYLFIRGAEAEKRQGGWLAGSVVAAFLGMASKEVAVSIPVMVLLYDRTFVSGSFVAALRRRTAYYLFLAATWLPLAYWVHSTGGNRGGTSGFGLAVSWWTYFQTQLPAVVTYLRLAVWPSRQIFFYEVNWVHGWTVVASGVFLTLLAGATIAAVIRRSAWGFLGVWFFAILSPTSLIPGMSQVIAEHRMYLALAPVCVAFVAALAWFAQRLRLPRFAWGATLSLTVVVLGILTLARTQVYASEAILWADTVAKAPGNPFSHNNLGIALVSEGKTVTAVGEFKIACELNPKYAEAHDNLGLALAEQGKLAEAVTEYRKAIELRPAYAEATANLGVALFQQRHFDEGIDQFRQAVGFAPHYTPTRLNLAAALVSVGRIPEAITEYKAAAQQSPNDPQVQIALGNALSRVGQWASAEKAFSRAVLLQPTNADAVANQGVALANLGRFTEAIAAYHRALVLTPADPDVTQNLALAEKSLAQRGDYRPAPGRP